MIIQNKTEKRTENNNGCIETKTETTVLVFKGKRQKGNYMVKHKNEYVQYDEPREVFVSKRLLNTIESIVNEDIADKEMAEKVCAFIQKILKKEKVLKEEEE